MPKKVEKIAEEVIAVTPEATPVVPEYDFEVDEPLIIKPQDLPLVVKPSAGKEWANEAQAEYARTLNGYAYKNPKKWAAKKGKLLKALTRLATEPSYINFLRGAEDENTKLTYSNKLVQP